MPALYEMVTGPAGVAGLSFDAGLVSRILHDTGSEPGALALMAFALRELYRASQPDSCLTTKAYSSFSGVKGAIGKRADTVFAQAEGAAQQAFDTVLKELVDVDPERGIPTRKRAAFSHFEPLGPARQLIDAFVAARLFVSDDSDRSTAVVEVAHEALLTHWPRLQKWIAARFDDLRLLRQLRQEAAEWVRLGRPKSHLWPHERLQAVYAMSERLDPTLTAVEQDFIRFEAERLIEEIADPATTHERRATIGDRLAEIGDPRPGVGVDARGLPEFVWLAVAAGDIDLAGGAGRFSVQPFFISKYPVTWIHSIAVSCRPMTVTLRRAGGKVWQNARTNPGRSFAPRTIIRRRMSPGTTRWPIAAGSAHGWVMRYACPPNGSGSRRRPAAIRPVNTLGLGIGIWLAPTRMKAV